MSVVRTSFSRFWPFLLLLLLAGALVVLYVLSTHVDHGSRSRVELLMRHVIALDTDINLDVLRLRYRQLQNYDSIADGSRQIDRILAELNGEFDSLGIVHSLRQARDAWQRKQLTLEDFKRQNSVLVNSQYHFVNLTEQIGNALEEKHQHSASFANVTRDVLVFTNGQLHEDADALTHELDALQAESKGWPADLLVQKRLLALHGKQIVNNHPAVQSLMRRIANNEFPSFLEQAYADYIKAYNQRIVLSETYRQLMAVFAFLMIVAIILIVLRLRQTAAALARNHALLDNIADHLGEGILSFDGSGRLNFLNRRAETLLGENEERLLGMPVQTLFPDDTLCKSAFLAALVSGNPFEGEEWLRRGEGRFPAQFLGGPLPASGENKRDGGYVTSFRDITLQRETDARLRLASRVFDNLSEAMSVTDPKGVIENVNAAFTTITGYTELEARGHTPGKLLSSGQHDKSFYRAMWGALARDGKWQGEITNRKKNGEIYQAWLSITSLVDENNEVLHYIALFSDISERKRIEERIHYLAYHDPLTKLANRLQFIDRLEHAIQEAHHTHRALTIMLLDLDRFKYINDSLSHSAGDILLRTVSQRLLRLLNEGDLLARVGGDGFALLLPNIAHQETATMLAQHLLQEFDTPFNLHGREVFVSACMGIALYPTDGEDAETLLKNVDTALYKAKDSGRSTFSCFQESDNANALENLELESELRHSVAQNELRLYYQPQIDAKTGKMIGVEALVRWQHPVRGLLPPDRFIPLAEISRYIETLGDWCLNTACRQFVAWQNLGLPLQRIAVNVSARQLNSPVFVDRVLEAVRTTNINPACLELELTESAVIHDPDRVFGIFSQLREHGIRIAIDDFGTGYSSLAYLSRYPVDVVKIDKSFVQNMSHEDEDRSVAKAVVLMAHAMDMETVAEGVETPEQSQRLKDFGCDLLQGYLYSRPVAPDQIPPLCGGPANDDCPAGDGA